MRTQTMVLVLGFAALAVGVEVACVPQERVTGRADVTDGDSFEIGPNRIRLFGVDAPEGRQPCMRDGREWACGDEAARKLRSLVGTSNLVCLKRDVDDYGRIVARCRNGNVDIAAEMARSGMALAYRRYSNDYVDEENEARTARRGVWAGEVTPPWEWRRDERSATTTAREVPEERRDGCYIKGNINGDGEKIYHVPGSPSYDNTVIDESRGERWFCRESAARGAGWRAPR